MNNKSINQKASVFCAFCKKIPIAMRMTLLFLFLLVFQLQAEHSYSQNTKISLEMKNSSIEKILQTIEERSAYYFLYNSKLIDVDRKTDIQAKEESIASVLNRLFDKQSVEYEVKGTQIILHPKGMNRIASDLIADIQQQKRQITGKITDVKGEPIIGANIVEKGTVNGNVTDLDGKFSLQVEDNAILQISYIGYLPQEVNTTGKTALSIILQEDMASLEELVVIGYGVQKKKLTTGASIQVEGESIQKLSTVNPLNALQSQTPGVNITKSSGQPGSAFNVTIRGIGTTGDSSPLYIVDGITVNNIDHLSPSDIESVDVLKDAATAAIYGARASNGIILVTTKQGKKGKPVIQYDGYLGVQNLYKKVQALNAQEYAMIMNEAAVNSKLAEYDFEKLVPDWDRIKRNEWNGTNWLDEITNRNALINNHAFNVVGGADNSTYSMGLSYSFQEGILGKPAVPKYERYTARMNSDHTLITGNGFDILKIGENLNYTYRNNKGIAVGDQYGNDIHFAMRSNPFLPVYDSDGEYHYAIPWNDQEANTVGMIHYNRDGNLSKQHSLNGNIYLILQPVKGLTYRSSFGINLNTSSYRQYQPVYKLSSINFRTEDIVVQQMNTNLGWIFDNTLTYDFKVNQDHSFNFLAGTSAERRGIGEILRGQNTNSVFDDFEHAYLNNTPIVYADRTQLNGYPLGDNRLLSVFGRVNYDYKETYLFSAILRGDGSSKFAKGHRWGRFPALSAGWIITNEPFLENQSNWLDFFKLRASWGRNGNQNITSFQYLSTISFNALYFPGIDKSKGTTAAYPDILANPKVTWETSEQLNIGFDSRFLKGRMGVVFDWYNKETKDWLVRAPLMGIMGTGAPFINGGDVRNRGFELGLSWNDQKGDFRYGVNVNLARNQNKVTRIANTEGIIRGAINVLSQVTTDFYRAEVGYPIGYFWGYKTNGVFQNQNEIDSYVNSKGEKIMPNAVPGDLIFANQNDDNIIDERDKVMIGDPNPDYNLGFSFNIGYKGLDLSMTSNGVMGNQIAKSYRAFASRTTENYTTDILNRWHGEGTSNSVPRVNINTHINDQYISDRYIEDGDYWRISNITLGYDFKRILKNLPFQQIRLYSTVQNAFTFTNYSGFDPEVGYGDNWAGGIDLGFYPVPRTVLFGITLKY